MPRDIYEIISSMMPEGVVFATPEQSREQFPKGAKDRWGKHYCLMILR